MADNADIIKEFLVGIGFQVDPASFKRFTGGVGAATAVVGQLGAELATTALAVGAMVDRVASRMNDLYYVSQRTGATVQNLQAFGYAAKSAGMNMSDTTSAIEGMARALREQPGTEGLLNSLGVQTREADGHMRDTARVVQDFVGRMKQLPFAVAAQYAQMVGMSSDALVNWENNLDAFAAAAEDSARRQKAAGIDPKDLSEKSNKFTLATAKLEDDLKNLGERITLDFIGPATKVVGWADHMVQDFNELDAATNGWAGTVSTLALSGLGLLIGKLLLTRTLFRTTGAAAKGAAADVAGLEAAAGGGAIAALSRLIGILAPLSLTSFAGTPMTEDEVKANEEDIKKNGTPLYQMFHRLFGSSTPDNDDGRSNSGTRDPRTVGLPPAPANGNATGAGSAQGVIDYFKRLGYGDNAAAAIAANVDRESGFEPSARNVDKNGVEHYGLAQWDPVRQAAFARLFGHDIHGASAEEQLAFIQHELTKGGDFATRRAGQELMKGGSPQDLSRIFGGGFERFGNDDTEFSKRGALADRYAQSSIAMNQTNHINVTGASDPKTIAKGVEGALRDVNDDHREALSNLISATH